jgi:hypothetical protein
MAVTLKSCLGRDTETGGYELEGDVSTIPRRLNNNPTIQK